MFPTYQSDHASSTSPSKKLHGRAAPTIKDLPNWDVDSAYVSTNELSDNRQTAVEMSALSRNNFTSINGNPNSSAIAYPSNAAKPRLTTSKNNPFFKAKPKPSGFDDMIPVSLTNPSVHAELETNTLVPGDTILNNNKDMVVNQPDYAAAASSHPTSTSQGHEMKERGGNLNRVLRGVGQGFNPYESEVKVADLVMYNDSEKKKGG